MRIRRNRRQRQTLQSPMQIIAVKVEMPVQMEMIAPMVPVTAKRRRKAVTGALAERRLLGHHTQTNSLV